jgi:hypothetical protein
MDSLKNRDGKMILNSSEIDDEFSVFVTGDETR